MGPIIDELAEEHDAKKLKVGKMNVDENPGIAGMYNIMSIPTILLFKGGVPVMQLVGLHNKADMRERIKEALE